MVFSTPSWRHTLIEAAESGCNSVAHFWMNGSHLQCRELLLKFTIIAFRHLHAQRVMLAIGKNDFQMSLIIGVISERMQKIRVKRDRVYACMEFCTNFCRLVIIAT